MRVLVVRAPVGGPVEVRGIGVVGCATWHGAAPPAEGIGTEIELNVPSDVDWSDISVGSESPAAGPCRSGGLVVNGIVADVDQDGVLALDTGGGVVLVDTVGDPPVGIVGCRFDLRSAMPNSSPWTCEVGSVVRPERLTTCAWDHPRPAGAASWTLTSSRDGRLV